MSRKREKNSRKERLRVRHLANRDATQERAENVLHALGYEITNDPIDDEDVRKLPDDVQDQLSELYKRVQIRPRGTIVELRELISRYPHIPQLYNYLYAAYANTGQKAKAVEIMKVNYGANPSYLFAKLNYSDYLVESGRPEMVSDIYNGKFDLGELYPERRKFHATEVISFHGVIGYYHVAMGQYDKAKRCFRVLQAISPNHGYTIRLKNSLKKLETLIA